MSLSNQVIIPGPELKKRIDKTADAVFKQPALKDKLLQRGEFEFLADNNEFNPYFLHRLQKAREAATIQKSTTSGAAAAASSSDNTSSGGAAAGAASSSATTTITSTDGAGISKALNAATKLEYTRDPLPEEFSVPLVASGVSALELDLIQHAAVHAAVHGDPFVKALQAKYSAQRKYEFLSKEHPRHLIFSRLRAAYRLILCTVATSVVPGATDGAAMGSEPAVSVGEQQAAAAFISRLQLLSGETAEDALGDPVRAREAFLVECNTKRDYMKQQELRMRSGLLSDAELRNRLNWNDFVVQRNFTLDDLKLA